MLREAGVNVHGVEELTGFPEMLGGRVKTLHPAVHGGILALRDDPGHLEELAQHGLKPIDVVVSNLYPFLQVARDSGAQLSLTLENIDIGGHTLLRAAAKNFLHVLPVCDPADYALRARRAGSTRWRGPEPGHAPPTGCQSLPVLRRVRHPRGHLPAAARRDLSERVHGRSVEDRRHALGRKPASAGGVLRRDVASTTPGRPSPAAAQLHGKAPSFNNTFDADLAWQVVSDFTSTCVAIVKHGNLCGLSLGDSVADAFRKALATDPQTAFGSAVAANRVVDDEAAHEIAAVFFEDLVAPDYTREALDVLRPQG